MLIKELLQNIEKLLPRDSAMDGDRIGLQVQSGRSKISNILVSMEITEEVVQEAKALEADCIVAFHPLIYRPMAEILDEERVGRITTMLIQNSISMISVHTTFDSYREGTSKILADRLGLKVEGFLLPDKKIQDFGMGVVCRATPPISEEDLVEKVSEKMYAPIKYCKGKSKVIETIAIVGGSGTSFINEVLAQEIDAFITADVSYHTFHLAKGRVLLIDPGHYEMEQFVSQGIAQILEKCVESDVIINISKTRTNPVSYFFGTDFEKMQEEYLNNVIINRYN